MHRCQVRIEKLFRSSQVEALQFSAGLVRVVIMVKVIIHVMRGWRTNGFKHMGDTHAPAQLSQEILPA